MASITPVHDGFFLALEHPSRESWFTVVYTQSPLRPSTDGVLTYTSRNFVVDRETGEREYLYGYGRYDDVLVPTPEPASIVLFGLGLAGLMAKRRAIGRRRVD